MNPLISFEGKRVVVTGAASGIGAATAALVAELGGEVITIDVRRPSAEFAQFIEVDLGERTSVEAAAGQIPAGPLHALINCAGIGNIAAGTRVMAVNFLGPRALTEALVPRLGPGSSITFVSSTSGLDWLRHIQPLTELLAIEDFDQAAQWCDAHAELVANGYAFSKKAIIAYTTARAVPLVREGIRVNCTSPGMVITPMVDDLVRVNGPEMLDAFPRPMGRDSTAEEQAAILAFLASDAASYIVGTNLVADGGLVAGVTSGQIVMTTPM